MLGIIYIDISLCISRPTLLVWGTMGLMSAKGCEKGVLVYMGLKLKSTNQKPEIWKSYLKLGVLFDLMSRLFNVKVGLPLDNPRQK